jgi:hypothetical protein
MMVKSPRNQRQKKASDWGFLRLCKRYFRDSGSMYFKQRYNCYFREIPPLRNGLIICVGDDEWVPWLGCIDRSVARLLPGARQIPLDFDGWRVRELDAWIWLMPGTRIVGCVIDLGVFAVTEFQKPLLKRVPLP